MVTLNGVDITATITEIGVRQVPRLNTLSMGIHSIALSQHLKNTLHQYEVRGIFSDGATDYTNKVSKIKNICDGGLPVWFDATDWETNELMFGRCSDFQYRLEEGRVSTYDWSFLFTSVFPWGYLQVISEAANTNFKIYDNDKFVQSKTLNPILRLCSFSKSATTVTYSLYVKNVGSSGGQVVLEMMIPDEITSGNVAAKITVSAGWTKAAGTVGTSGFSSTPGTKQRVTLTKTLGAGVEEALSVTINYVSAKTSYLDGSIDDIAG